MKKSAVAVAIVAFLGAGWAGASWYTGVLLEKRMADEIAKINAAIGKYFPKAGVKLAYEDYQRSVFSTTARFILQADPAFKGEGFLKPEQTIVAKETIDHGPLPLAQLARFNLLPSMAFVRSELENTPLVKGIFDATGGKSPFAASSRIAYSGGISSELNFIPVDYTKDKTRIKFSGATVNGDVSADYLATKATLDSDNLTITAPNAQGEVETLSLEGITLNSDTYRGKLDINTGTSNLLIKKIMINVNDQKNAVLLEGLAADAISSEKEQNINGELTYTLDALKVGDKNFGSGKATLKASGIDGKQLKAFSEQYNMFVTSALTTDKNMDAEEHSQQLVELFSKHIPLLLANNPTIQLQPLSWKNDQGESTFTLNVTLSDPQKGTRPNLGMLNAIQKLDATLDIATPMATRLLSQAGELEGYNREQADKMAQEQINGLAAMGQMFKLTTQKDQNIISNLHYSDGIIDLNGQKMPAEALMKNLLSGSDSDASDNESDGSDNTAPHK